MSNSLHVASTYKISYAGTPFGGRFGNGDDLMSFLDYFGIPYYGENTTSDYCDLEITYDDIVCVLEDIEKGEYKEAKGADVLQKTGFTIEELKKFFNDLIELADQDDSFIHLSVF